MPLSDLAWLIGLGVLVVGAVWTVWRGMARDADASKNTPNSGGGPGDGGGGD